MACGVPVIASRVDGIPAVVGDAGELVDVGDVEALATSLRRVLGDDGLRTDLVERGRRQARLFTCDRTAEAYLDVYRIAAS